ncbi:hypothetical protein ENSA5_20030 [Enhygromyxa salina]|uniref:Uncharacterized protein n=1 Tax=Enhygromyxa salina TaxID=215803 RepID=A0A2S9YCS4_9BACT|nr:hypothetical protein ENSA5_20030 [Enhygromyxa salina]
MKGAGDQSESLDGARTSLGVGTFGRPGHCVAGSLVGSS